MMPEILKQLVQLGRMRAPEANIKDISYLISEWAGLTSSEFQLKRDSEASGKLEKQLQKDFKELARNISPQYILGCAWFLGYKIMVQRGILIPQFETEELVEWALDHLHNGMRILGLGTGSGAIMIALTKKVSKKGIKDLTLYASGISDSALRTCEESFLTSDLDVTVHKASALVGLEEFGSIVSNPPYIWPGERNLMSNNVLQNEPEEALFGGKDGLEFYRRFAKQVREHLTDEGQFFLEFGFGEEDNLAGLFTEELPDFKVEFKNDLAGKPRMVYGKWQE